MKNNLVRALLASLCFNCGGTQPRVELGSKFEPKEIIDLGALITEETPEQYWGALLKASGFSRSNDFEVIAKTFEGDGETLHVVNSYYTFFNHGGPHIDAPSHMSWGDGLDSFSLDAFSGPVKVFDVSGYPRGRSVPRVVFAGKAEPGDVVLLLTRHDAPREEAPAHIALTNEAADYLSSLPVRALGTDAFNVESPDDMTRPMIHHYFLSRGIPLYEQLENVEKLLGKERMFFVGVPLNVQDGDGMLVRPVVFVY